MAETKDIIDALSDGDNIGAEQAFKDSIKTKVKQDFDITINGLIRASKLIK